MLIVILDQIQLINIVLLLLELVSNNIEPEVFEALVDEYKRRKPNQFLDLDKLGELGGKFN